MIRRNFLMLSIVCLVGFAATTSAWAKKPPRPTPAASQQARPDINSWPESNPMGFVEGVGPSGITMKSGVESMAVVIQPPFIKKIEVTGTAERSFLQQGMFVSFTTDLNGKLTSEAEIKTLTLVSPGEKEQPGVFDAVTGAAFGPIAAKKGGKFTVVGQIALLKGEQLTVNAGGKRVKATLAAEPTIEIKNAEWSWAQPGDAINVKGKLYKQQNSTIAQEVSITLSKPMTATEKKKPGTKSSAKSAEDKKSDDKPEPKGAKPEKKP